MIDSHTHLYDSQYDSDRERVLDRARKAGVRAMLAIGCDLESSRAAVRLAEENDAIYATVGIHPHEAGKASEGLYVPLRALSEHPRVVGIGETGLDFFYMHSPREAQMSHFRRHIRLAKETGKPLVIHNRDADSDTLLILKENSPFPAGGVFHCFTGNARTAKEALALGFYLSFSGILTFKNAGDLRSVARECPLDRILIETDCPYLAPVPFRGKRNEPAHVQFVARELAELHTDQDEEQIRRKTADNARRLFDIPRSAGT